MTHPPDTGSSGPSFDVSTIEGFSATTPAPLYWRADGQVDAPPLVLLHGGPGAHHDYLYPQLLALTATHRVITYDQRGGGRSRTDDPAPITSEVQVEDLGTLLGEFEATGLITEPPALVGYSWGALLALLYLIRAAETPELPRPARVVLLSPAPITRSWRRGFEEALADRQRAPAVQLLREALAASGLREADPAAYRQRSFELSVAGYFADPSMARGLTPFRVTGRTQQSVWESLGEYDLREPARQAAARLGIPTLVVHGREDPIPMESAAAAAEALRAPLVALEACGHVPYVEQPEALAAALHAFLVPAA